MKSFEIKITGNAKSLVDSIKSSQSAMDALIKGIDKADKKLEVLTQTGSHLSNIDKQLAKLKTDYPDIFEKIFPNIDSQINESMKPILQMPELVEQIMTKVAQKMKAIDSGTLKATDDDIKELGNDMRILGETLHLENLDMSFLDGTAKAETKIKRLIDVMFRLVEAYYNVNRAAANVDVENVAQKKNGSKKSKGNIKTSPVDDETSTKKELSEIDRYQQILKVINGEDIKLKTTKKDDLEQLKLLVTQFDEATNAIKRFEATRDTNSDKYKEALAEQYRLAVLLKNTMDDVADNGSERAVNFISSQTGKFGAYSKAEELIKTGFGPNLTKDIGEIFTKKIEKASFSYERLTESVERFHEIFQKVNNDDNLTDEETDALYEEAENIKNTFSSLDIRTKDFFENLSLGVINTKEVIQELVKMFGIELPAAMDKPEEKIQKLLPTSEGLEKLRIIPDGNQKARISEYAEEYRVILKLLEKGNIESKETVQALRERARTLKNIIKDVNPGDTTLDKLLTDGYGISKGTADTVASPKLSSKFKIDEFKSENISNDARQEAIDLIYREISAENQLARKKEEAALSYDKLIKAVERYYELQSKLDSVTNSDKFDEIKDEADKIADRFAEMNSSSSGVFNAIKDGLGKDETLKQLADIFGIKIPEATKKAESGIKHVTSALSETSDGLAKIMYHRGNLLSSKSGTRDNFGQMPGNLTKSVEDDETWKSLGFGIFGGGLFGVANPSMINGPLSKLSGSTFIQSIDLSKYNMYMADTEERAANLAKFMSQLQKFAIKREVPDFTGFDTELSGVSEESLYKQFQGVFDATDMTKEKFLAFISEMRVLLQEAGIEFDKDLNELTFKNKDSSILSSDNISTRLLKQLGYQGVYTGETSYGGFGQGSVLFDFDVTDIIGYFNTVEQATQDFQNSLKNGWTGSNEQLQQYLSNIEEISARIEATKTKQLSFNPNFDISAYDNTLNALNSVKENIQKILSGESIITDSGKISGEFKTITSSAQEVTSAVEGTSAAIENTGVIGSSIEGLNDGVEKAKRTLEEFRALQDEILGKSASAEGGSMDGEAIGRYTERVETAKAKLDELAKQSLLTADQIKEANDIYETAIGNLEGKSRTNNEHIEDLEGREQVGSYDSGYDRGYYDARSDADSELDNLRKQLNEAEAELNRSKASMDSGKPIDISTELQSLENIRTKLEEVKNTIISKNKAFNDEGVIVGQVVSKEIRTLDLLLNKINDITNAINTKTESFQTEGNVVSESVKQATKIKEETKKKDTFDTDKENLISVVSEYEKSLSDVQFIPDDALNKVSEMQAKLKYITNSNDLAKWKSEWDLLTESIESARKEQEELIFEKQKNQLTGIKNTLSNSYKSAKIDATNVPEELQEVKTGYEDIVARINTCIKQRKILTEEEVVGFAKEAATIKQVLDAYTEKTKVQTKNSSAYGSAFVKNATNKYDRLYSIATNDEFGVSPAVVTKAQELKSVYEQIVSLNKSFANTNPSEEQRIAFNRLTDEFNETYSALDKIIKSSRKLAQNGSNIFELYNDGKIEFDLSSEEGRMTALKEAVNFMSDGKAQIGEFNRECTALNYTVKNSDGTFTEFTARINEAGTAIVETTGKTQKSTTMFGRFFDELKRKASGIATYLISITSFQRVWQEIRQGITYIKEIDSALTELKKVTDETNETYEKFLDTASKVGSEIGSTIADFTNATADFARLGYSISEATKLAEAASIYKNVGDGIDSVAQATESIISTMKAFGIEADNSMAIVDKFNEVGNNFAISSTGIGEALQRSASALYESGNTLDESIALITAANSVIQNPEQVGIALKTLSLRLRGAKVELEEAGEDVDGMADSVSSLQAKLLALTHGKVNIMADASTFKNTTQILREMSKAWEDMTDIERSAALELMGGKRQANILASIIKNYDTVDSVIESSINSQNSAYEENIKWMDSIEGKMTKFNNAVQSLWQDTLGSNAIKDVVDLGTGLVKILDTIGVIPSILGGIAIYFTAIKKNNPITMFKDLMNTIQNFSTAVTNVQTLSKAGVVFDSNSVSTYAAAVSDLSAKQQALALSSAGLTKQQVAEVLAKNGCSEATIEQAVAEASLATAKATTNTITGEQLLNLAAENDIKLSEQATTWLAANAEKELTRQKILAAVASGELEKADGAALLAMSGLTGGVKGLGAALKALFLNNPIGLALMAVTAITAIVSAVKRAKEEAKQAAQETLNAYKDAQNTLKSNKNTINEISSDYERLSKGVDDFGNNISLTTDEYKKYNEITNKIADMFPGMISGYTKEGNAILLCKGNVEELTKAYEAAAQAARQEAIAGGNDVFKSSKEEYSNNPNTPLGGETGIVNEKILANKLIELVNNGNEEELKQFIGNLEREAAGVEIDGKKFFKVNLIDTLEAAGIKIPWNKEINAEDIQNGLQKLQSFVRSSVTKINTETSKVKSILSAYLGEDENYAKLDDKTKSIVDNIVSQLDSEFIFSFDNIDSLYNWISENIVGAFKDNGGKVQGAISDFLKIDTSKLSVSDYKKEIENLKKILSDSGISEEAQQQILSAFKIDDDSTKEEIDPLVNHTKSILKDEFDNKVDDLTISDLKIIDTLDIPEGTLLTWDELLGKIQEVKSEMQSPIVDTYSSNKESVESLVEVSTILNEATSDGVQLTQEQGELLKKLIGTQEGYSDAIDETNGCVVKNATLLRRLITQKKDEQRATIRAAKSYSQLQYKNTTKQLYQLVAAMKNEYQANGKVSASTLKNVEALRAQIAELKKTTHEYAILELKLSDVTNAYQEFEDAKNTDSELSYGDSMIEMLNTINDGFKTGQVGTEAFRTAVEALVPSSVYSDLDNFNDRMVAIHDYIDKNPLFADWFTIKDGEFSITQKNIQAFVEDAQKSGAFTQSDANGNFFLADDINSIDKFVDKINKGAEGAGVTKEAVIAMLTEFSKYDASWSDILSDLTTNSFDKEVNKCTDALDNALLAQENFIRSGGDLNSDEWKTICDNVEKAKIELDNATESANNNATTWIQLETLYSATTGEMKLTQLQADKLAQALGLISEDQHITIEDGAIKLTQEQCDILNQKRQELEEPSIMAIQTNYDQIVAQIDELQRYIDGKLTPKEEKEIEAKYNITNKEEAKAQINDVLNPEKNEIELKYNITKTSDEQTQGDIEKLKDWEANGVKFKVSAEIDEGASNTVKETEKDFGKDIKPQILPQVNKIARVTAENILDDIAKDRTSTVYVKTVETVSGTNTSSGRYGKTRRGRFDGTANASGSWGLPQAERNSLVGEIGQELVVDPHSGKYYTVGDNGAELVNLPKDAIVFNHKQTKEILNNGHISSRGKMIGGALAEGNAHYGLFAGYTDYNEVFKNGSNEWVHAWDDTMRDLSDAADSLSSASDGMSDAADDFKEVFDWFEVLLEEIENNINLMTAQLENAIGTEAKKNIYYQILDTEYFKVKELNDGIKLYSDYANKLLAKVPDQYKEMAKNGAVAITDFLGEANQEVVDSINNYREWAKKVTDLNQQLEETKKTIADTHVEIQNMLKDEYDNRISLITSVNDRIQGTIDLLDEEGKRSSAVMYEEMIKNSTKQLSELQSKRAEMQRALDEAVRSGDVARESSQWYEMVNAINDVDSEINDCRIDLEGFQNSINQLHWDNFEKFIDAIDNVGNEISNLGDLIDEEDVVDEVGNWTDKGITALGLYAQEMERAKYRAEQYGKEIEYLNQEYAAGKYSEDEYLEKLQELKDGQWDSIKSYEAAKKSIIDLNKTRVEAIKDGIQKEIDAYSELIDKKKEELSLQKDAHDFSKQVAEQQKNIANIQKQLAAMAGDNSASAIARRKQLEAELAAAQEELDELYYNHSVEKQQEALDKSLENYQDDKQNEMDALDESLKNEEQIIADSYATITANTESVAQTLSDIASQYGITLSDSVMQPWLDGANAIGTYQEQLDTSMSSFTQQLEALKQMYADLQNQADSAGRSMVDAINGNKSKTESATYTPPTPSQPSTPSKPSKPSAPSTGSSVTVKKSATRFSRDGGNGTRMQSWVPGSTFTVYQVSGSEVLIGRNGQYTGWVRLSDIEGYAKGTKEIQNNQLAMLDELGDELVLHAGKNGRLEYLTKGTSVVPADITSNLMKLGSLDPKDILERNRPSIGAPHVIDNSIELKMEFGSLVHVDTVSNDTLPYLQKMVRNEFDNCMKHVNQGLKKFVR